MFFFNRSGQNPYPLLWMLEVSESHAEVRLPYLCNFSDANQLMFDNIFGMFYIAIYQLYHNEKMKGAVMRLVGLFVAFWSVFVSLGSSAVYANIHDYNNVTPEEILSIAEAKKDIYFGMLGFNYLVKYPDEAASDSGLELDYPFRIYSMNSLEILKYKTGDNFASMLLPTVEWLVPMSRSEKSRFCISVGYMNGEWQAVGIGMGDFGERLKKNIPPEYMPGKNGSKYVRIESISVDFIAVQDGDEIKLMSIPIDNYPEDDYMFPPDKKDSRGLYSVADVMPNLAASVRQSLGIYPLIRINGMGYMGSYSTDSQQNISVTLSLADMWDNTANADWWVALERDGQRYYLNSSMKWVADQVTIAQMPLQNIVGFPIYSGTLPVGTYKLYFGVDLTQDGVVNEPLFWDMATIIVK